MEDSHTEPQSERRRASVKDVLDGFQSLTPKKQAFVLKTLAPGFSVDTPEGLHVIVRSRKELRRFTHRKDEYVIEWLRAFEPGDVFYDIGANCGGLTLSAAAMHRDRITVVAIEPAFGSFEAMARNLSSNGMLTFVVPLQVALFDRTGLETMYYRTTEPGSSQHGLATATGQLGESFEAATTQLVPAFRLDDLIAVLNLPPPTRVKIDVDGYESKVLAGSVATLGAGTIRELLIEVVNHDGRGTRLREISAFLADHRYELTRTFEHPPPEEGGDLEVSDHLYRAIT